jgi:hypothetical protein
MTQSHGTSSFVARYFTAALGRSIIDHQTRSVLGRLPVDLVSLVHEANPFNRVIDLSSLPSSFAFQQITCFAAKHDKN